MVKVARELAPEGVRIRGVRLDSGNLAELAVDVRHILDEGGLTDTEIFASGDLDEYRIARILGLGAPVDAFGVGTQLGTSADAPALGGVYKLVEDVHGPKVKLSPEKKTWPGRKQVYRLSAGGRYLRDVVALETEAVPGGRPLLQRVMADGVRITPAEPLDALRERCRETVASLPERLLQLHSSLHRYPVERSEGLREALHEAVERTRNRLLGEAPAG